MYTGGAGSAVLGFPGFCISTPGAMYMVSVVGSKSTIIYYRGIKQIHLW